MHKTELGRVWTVAEAKARLSEILRLAEEEGPQRIGARKPFVGVPAAAWEEKARPHKPLGQWLVENMPHGTESRDSRPPCGVPSRDSVRRLG